ncbi:hypothetical protein SKAU_G00370320 [Synaphobranchus kaupii]|uniref:Uncharacterized protein n=1 Tax=Synaphobranchus kaupii TaxID=118154 RepID=A0A9Q1EFX9_SYNKA|nr:hypothetical protein SKAU_G00370320 [Synaphobranchus kaupii]
MAIIAYRGQNTEKERSKPVGQWIPLLTILAISPPKSAPIACTAAPLGRTLCPSYPSSSPLLPPNLTPHALQWPSELLARTLTALTRTAASQSPAPTGRKKRGRGRREAGPLWAPLLCPTTSLRGGEAHGSEMGDWCQELMRMKRLRVESSISGVGERGEREGSKGGGTGGPAPRAGGCSREGRLRARQELKVKLQETRGKLLELQEKVRRAIETTSETGSFRRGRVDGGRVWLGCGLVRGEWEVGGIEGQKFVEALKQELGSAVARVIDRVVHLYGQSRPPPWPASPPVEGAGQKAEGKSRPGASVALSGAAGGFALSRKDPRRAENRLTIRAASKLPSCPK